MDISEIYICVDAGTILCCAASLSNPIRTVDRARWVPIFCNQKEYMNHSWVGMLVGMGLVLSTLVDCLDSEKCRNADLWRPWCIGGVC